jgi:Spy/CpxP family protein refolding chaperone
MRITRWFPLVLTASACGGVAAAPQTAQPSSVGITTLDEAAIDTLTDRQPPDAFGSVTLFIARGVDVLPVTPAQRTQLAPIAQELYAKTSVVMDAEHALMTTLANGLAAGAIDPGAVESGVDRIKVDATSVYNLATDTLNRLHAMLSREQRMMLVAGLQARFAKWLQANPLSDARPDGQLASVTTELGIPQDRVDSIRQRFDVLMKQSPPLDIGAVASRMRAFEDQFASDSFAARAAPQNSVGPELAAWAATRVARLCEALQDVLTPDQRTKLIEILRRR